MGADAFPDAVIGIEGLVLVLGLKDGAAGDKGLHPAGMGFQLRRMVWGLCPCPAQGQPGF